MRTLLGSGALLAFTFLSPNVWTARSQPLPSTAFTRTLLRAADAPTARSVLGLDGSATVTNLTVNNINLNVVSNYQTIQVNTNVTFNQNINVSGKATFNSFLVVSNGVQVASIAWAGPTNTLPLNAGRQHLASATACSVTGFTQKSTTNVQPFVLEILNTSATNWVFTPPPGFADLNYVANYTVTNGTVLIWSGEYDPYLSRTNGLGRIAP